MTKTKLLFVSLLLVFGLGVTVPSALAAAAPVLSLPFAYGYGTMRPNSNAETTQYIQLGVTTAGTIPIGETFTVTYSQPIVGALDINSSLWDDFCYSSTAFCSSSTVSASGNTLSFITTANIAMATTDYIVFWGVRVPTSGLPGNYIVTATVGIVYFPGNPTLFTNGADSFTLNVGYVQAKTALTVEGPTSPTGNILTCFTIPSDQNSSNTFTVSVAETYGGAWTSVLDETERAPYAPVAPDYQVTNGSDVSITVTGIPQGVTVTPSKAKTTTPSGSGFPKWGGVTPTYYTGAKANDMVTFDYPLTDYTFWGEIESADFTFTITSTGPLTPNNPPMSFYVQLNPTPASSSAYPSFTYPALGYNAEEEASSVASYVFSFVDCTTSLLFPYVTNYNGGASAGPLGNWDTAIEVANTTSDPFTSLATNPAHATAQNGPCTFSFYNAGTASAVGTPKGAAPVFTYTTPVVLSGGVYAFMLSTTPAKDLPGGYAIAVCGFMDGAGYAAILDNANGLGNWQVYANYLAQVLNSSNHQ